jgi:hypothetical protein
MELKLQLYQLSRRYLIWSLGYRGRIRLQLNLEINVSLRRHSWQVVWKNI